MRASYTTLALMAAILPATAQPSAIMLPAEVEFETGDTWHLDATKYRLYGVQACLRGSNFTAVDGKSGDCGLYSVATIAALFSTGSVACQEVGRSPTDAQIVICAAQVGEKTVDLGTALISSGSAFAALLSSGAPVSAPYAIAEDIARSRGVGLWSGGFDHPSAALKRGGMD